MKNKPIQNNKKGQQKILSAPNSHKNVKNRDQLRKKLKGLLDKQVLSPEQKAHQKIHTNTNRSHYTNSFDKKSNIKSKDYILNGKDTNSNSNTIPLKHKANINRKDSKAKNPTNSNMKNEGHQSVLPKSNISKKNKKFVISNGKSKSNDASLKRELSEKSESSKKATKKPGSISNDKFEKKKPSTVSGKKIGPKQVKSPKMKTDKGEAKKTASKKKGKLSKIKSKMSVKREQYTHGRGPLRPQTSESEFDAELDSSPRPLKRKHKCNIPSESEIDSSPKTKQKILNPSQALMRAENVFEDSCSNNNRNDASYFDFLFDGTYDDSEETTSWSADSQNEHTEEESEFEYSDEESDFEYASKSSENESQENFEEYSEDDYSDDYSSDLNDYFHSSDDDDSYQPPENLLEDVYIAKGTAVKYELSTEDVGFDSDTQCAQIIEMPTKITEQKGAAAISESSPTDSKQKQMNKTTFGNDEASMSDSDESCPELVPIESKHDDTSSFYSSSSYSSHSCCSSCDCGSCDEIGDTTISDKEYKPMTPEVIKAQAEVIDEIDNFFHTESDDHQTKATPNSVLEELSSSYINPLQFKVYTINNEMLNNDSFSSESSKTNEERSQKGVDEQNEISCFVTKQKMNESPQNKINGTTHVSKKAKIIPVLSSHNELPGRTSYETTDERSQKGVDEQSENSCSVTKQTINETPQEKINDTTHVSKKANITPVLSSHNELPPRTSFKTTAESNTFKEKDKTNSTKPSQPKNSIRTLFFNAINCNHVIVLLKDPLYIYGTVKLKLLAGYLEIFGYNPKRNEVLEIFSPRGYSSLKIEPSYSNFNVPLNEKELLSLTPFFIRSDLEEIQKKFDPTKDAIVILERNDRSKKVNMLRKYMVEHLFPNMNSIQSDRPFYASEFLLRCIITPNSDNALTINPDWNTIRVQKNSKIMIIGGKSVGKSTLARYLINTNLKKYEKILLVDLDIGQPEMFIPQTVSATTLTAPLLGPGYFLNKQPDKSFLVGHFNILHSLDQYIESLNALFEYCNSNSDYKEIPWIVNTMGYNKGFGDELISVICSLLHPSNIVQFESEREINDFDMIMMKENVKSIERNIVGDTFKPINEFVPQHQLTLIRSFVPMSRIRKNQVAMKPRDMRLVMILTRLSSTLIGHAEWMTDVKPLCASIDDLNIIKMGDDQIGKEDLVKTLVGNLVYLCRMEPGKAHECFGIGIVRGVDYPLRQIYLLPTIPLDLLSSVNCLAICGIPLPSSILLNQGPKVKGAASYVYNTLDEAASMYIMQMYKKPQQFPTVIRK